MTTFTTVEELMQVLDANPHLLEGLRSRLLTRELLELPETVARLTDRVDHLTERMDHLTETVDRLADSTDRRLDALERGMRWVQDDIGGFRNLMASNAVLKNATAIANSLGLRRARNLSQDDLLDLVEGQDIADIPRNEWDSFLIADLIMEATGDAQTCYVAVEASYTADERDTRRAIRNAGYMTRLTGLPAHAVIVAARTDRRIDELVGSGEVHLYRMPERGLRAE